MDLAAGRGANALFLAQKGHSVFATDISDVALANVAYRHTRLHAICLDLDVWDIPDNFFDLIINIRYLNRRLFPQIITGLKSEGVVIIQTYLNVDPKHRSSRPFCRDYLLHPNELLHAFLPLHLIYFREDLHTPDGKRGCQASLVAVKKPLYK